VAGQGRHRGHPGGRLLGGRARAPGLPAEAPPRLHLPLPSPWVEAPEAGATYRCRPAPARSTAPSPATMTDRSSPAGSHRASCAQTTSPSTPSRASPRPAGSNSPGPRGSATCGVAWRRRWPSSPPTSRRRSGWKEAELGAEERRLGSTPSSSAPFPRDHPISTGRWSVPSKPTGSNSMRPRT
jgi:hypothetical protein